MEKVRVAVFGASGYGGAELLRLLSRHPRAAIVALGAASAAGKAPAELYPALRGLPLPVMERLEAAPLKGRADLAFLALPHTEAMALAPELLALGLKVIDFSGDFRLKDASLYPAWYKVEHKAPALLKEAVYGLCEVNRAVIAKARLVANPGCYTSSAILPLYPLLRAGLLEPQGIVVDAKSGVTGAGRKLAQATQFCEVDANFLAYKVAGTHQHTPELEQLLSEAAGAELKVLFTPHLLPVNRGILSTIYARPKAGAGEAELLAALDKVYGAEPFVSVLMKGELPSLRSVVGTNLCEIGLKLDKRTNTVVLVSAVDNLCKGAAGQAVQNMNILFGLDETLGLDLLPLPV